MKKSTKRFKEWVKKSSLYGAWFPNGVSQKTLQKYLAKAYKAGYEQGLKDKEVQNEQERSKIIQEVSTSKYKLYC